MTDKPLDIPSAALAAQHISEVVKNAATVDDIIQKLTGGAHRRDGGTATATTNVTSSSSNSNGNEGEASATAATELEDEESLINQVDADGRTALHWCLSLRRFDLAVALQQAPYHARIDTADTDGTTTLATACSVDAPEAILSLLLAAATAENNLWNAGDVAGNTPLLLVASRGNLAGLKLLLATIPSDAELRFRPAERLAAEAAAASANASGASKAAASTTETSTPTAAAATAAAAATTTSDNVIPASENNADNDNPTTATTAPPQSVSITCYCDVFAVNKRRQTALHRAMARGAHEFVEELVAWCRKRVTDKASLRNLLNAQDTQGNTALHYAAMENNQDLGQLLLRAGASREVKNKDGLEYWQL